MTGSGRNSSPFLWCLILVAAATWASPCAAQWVPTRGFSVKDGLAQSQVTDLVQGEHGYLWVGTQSGLSRFDGRHFTTFTRLSGLPDDLITALGTGGNHRLWIGSDSGHVAIWDGLSFQTLTPGNEKISQPINGLVPRGSDEVLIASPTGLWLWSNHEPHCLIDDDIRMLVAEDDETVWALGHTVYLVNADRVRMLTLPPALGDPTALAASSAGLWLGDDRGQVMLLDRSQRILRKATVDRSVRCLLPTPSGTLWIGADDGLWRWEPDAVPTRQPLHANDPRVEIHDLQMDHEGNLWIGTWAEGLHMLPPDGFMVFDRSSGLPATNIWNFVEDDEGCVWMASEDAGVLRYCNGDLKLTLASGAELPPGRWIDLETDGKGGFWIAGAAGVIHRARDGRLKHWTSADGLPDDYSRVLYRDRSDTLWVGTRAGLAAWRGGTWQIWDKAGGMPDDNVRGLDEDQNGNLWIATHNAGVLRFDGRSFRAFSTEAGLPNARVWCLMVDSHQKLWAGTDDGLWVYSLEHGTTQVVNTEHGLLSPNILFLAEDHDGLIWIGTTRGLSLATPEGTVMRSFTAEDGLTDSEGAENAVLVDSQGMLWVGMATGATRLDPRHLPDNRVAPPLVIERIFLNGRDSGRPQPLATSSTAGVQETLNCPPETTDLRLEFAALSFTSPEKVRYRFMLEGYDPAMGPATEESRVTYRRVPPGRYTFVLTACNNAGVWTSSALELPLVIQPAWYQALWFRTAFALGLLCLTLGWLRIHNANQARRQRKLEQEVELRTAELARANMLISEQNRQLEELSRTDPLTGLANRRVLAEQMPVEIALVHRELERHTPSDLSTQPGIAVVVIDLDHFKAINDKHGHERGDQVLAAVASRIYASVREIDLAVRWGGEEFVVLARSVVRESTIALVSRLLQVIAATEVVGPTGQRIGTTASIGFVCYPLAQADPLGGRDWRELVDAADRFMYLAKDRGRARACGVVTTHHETARPSERKLIEQIQNNPLDSIPGCELVDLELIPGDASEGS